MTDNGRPRRQVRNQSAKSYRVEDHYAHIDENEPHDSGSSRQRSLAETEQDEDGDVFMPDQQDDQDDADEFIDEHASDDSSEKSIQTPASKVSRKASLLDAGFYNLNSGSTHDSPSQTPQKGPLLHSPLHPPLSTAAAGLGVRRVKPFAKSQGTKVRNMGIDSKHARGVDDWARGGGQEARVKDLFGPEQDDLKAVLLTRDQWSKQETLPCRAEGSLSRSFYVNEEGRRREIDKFREWYSTAGTAEFSRSQKKNNLTKEEARKYLENPGPQSLNILMGSLTEPQLLNLTKGSFVSTAEAFDEKEDRRGWVVNIGSRVQDIQWASNEEGCTQYLAVAVEQKPNSAPKPLRNPKAPAFTATKPFPASIQIWSFGSNEEGELDPEREPRLELVICTDWGAPKQLRWCPVAPADNVNEESNVNLGLLATMWSDGGVRILDVAFQTSSESVHAPQYIHYTKAAFDAHLPHTVPSCIHWLSATSFATGSAAGTLAIWTLTHASTFPPLNHSLPEYNPQPTFYRQVSNTFILTLSSGWPSLPAYISITTADGYGKLIDLRSPDTDTVLTAKGRIFATAQSWHEHTQSFLMPDENYLFRHNSIRRYYTNIYSMRVDSQIVCCATSPVQPGVLIGCADGLVTSSNPVGRVLNQKETPFQQIWFTHDWRPPVDQLLMKVKDAGGEDEDQNDSSQPAASTSANTTTGAPKTKVPAHVLSQPLTRFNEGYRVQQVTLQYAKSRKETNEVIKKITIYEEPSGITCLAWNPNLRCGTWAVAGMGDGLIRVEDLGV
ncbi:hypothetical protein B0J11DRAFT_452401 [Dendryphion nanum]|uniref:Transcription factor TFIIIC complex subunit Tfc6 n=1 Tax=Dendryphion nanum TaxID=256645 RepID=A0A9P9EH29_9PLEO|nr:hypothetical protein B0J11DRAFT_452401 [Dendryphion nanum]